MSLFRYLLLGTACAALAGSSLAAVVPQNQECSPNPTVVTVEVIQVYVLCPVLVSTYVAESTKILLAPGCTIDVSNAPTLLSTVVTVTTYSESSITLSSPHPTSSALHSLSHQRHSTPGYPVIPPPYQTTAEGHQHRSTTSQNHHHASATGYPLLPPPPPYQTTSGDRHHQHRNHSTRYVTSTTFLPSNGTAFTSTIPGNWRRPGTVIVGYVESLVTETITGPVATTVTVPPSGTVPGTVVVETQPWVTATTYLDNGQPAYTTTVGFNVTVGVPVGTITTTTFLDPTAAAFTSTIPALGPTSGTVLVGYVESIVTETITGSVAATTTIAPSGTVTGTVIVTVPTPDISCNNQGIEWAVFNNFVQNTGPGYPTFEPTVFKQEAPLYSSVTDTIGGIDDGGSAPFSIYGSSETFGPTYFALNHRGYLFAPSTGLYTFAITNPDDIVLIWEGPAAYEGYTTGNSDIVATFTYTDGNAQDRSFQVELIEGEYYPIRIIFGQAQGGAEFIASIISPDGTVLLNSASGYSPYLVQFSCDGILAPVYPAWGNES